MNYDINEFKLVSNISGIATLKLSKNTVVFSRTVSLKLGCPSFVQILVNTEKRLIAVRACLESDTDALKFGEGLITIRRRGVFRELARLVIGFDPDTLESVCMDGEYDEEGKILLFNAREYYTENRQLIMQGMD